MKFLKTWLKNLLERALVCPLFVHTEVLKRSTVKASEKNFHLIMPHRLNWKLTSSALRSFRKLSSKNHSFTLVVNFDEIPADWEGWQWTDLTIVRNTITPLGRLFRMAFNKENGSINNALAIDRGIKAEPDFRFAFIAHSDSAPLCADWDKYFFQALGENLVIGNVRDRTRVNAAHSSGTLFRQDEFLRRGGTVWPLYQFGRMVWDVSDGITMALHPPALGPVPMLENSLYNPELGSRLRENGGMLAEFVETGTIVSFDAKCTKPIFAHMGRGTPRSQKDPAFAKRPAVDLWAEMIDGIN